MEDYKEKEEQSSNIIPEDFEDVSKIMSKFQMLEVILHETFDQNIDSDFHKAATEIYNLFLMKCDQIVECVFQNGLINFLINIALNNNSNFYIDALYIISGIVSMHTTAVTYYIQKNDNFLIFLSSICDEDNPNVIKSAIRIIFSIIYDCEKLDIEFPFQFDYDVIARFYDICPSLNEEILTIIAWILESNQYNGNLSNFFDLAKIIIRKGGNTSVIILAFSNLIRNDVDIFQHIDLTDFFTTAIFPLLNSNNIENVESTLRFLFLCLSKFDTDISKEISIKSPVEKIIELIHSTNENVAFEAMQIFQIILIRSQSTKFTTQEFIEFLIDIAVDASFRESLAAIGVLHQIFIIDNSDEIKNKLLSSSFLEILIDRIDSENPKSSEEPLKLLARLLENGHLQSDVISEALSESDLDSFIETLEEIKSFNDLPEDIQRDIEITYSTVSYLLK